MKFKAQPYNKFRNVNLSALGAALHEAATPHGDTTDNKDNNTSDEVISPILPPVSDPVINPMPSIKDSPIVKSTESIKCIPIDYLPDHPYSANSTDKPITAVSWDCLKSLSVDKDTGVVMIEVPSKLKSAESVTVEVPDNALTISLKTKNSSKEKKQNSKQNILAHKSDKADAQHHMRWLPNKSHKSEPKSKKQAPKQSNTTKIPAISDHTKNSLRGLIGAKKIAQQKTVKILEKHFPVVNKSPE